MAGTVSFAKYHGLGNDFVIIDDRAGKRAFSARQIRRLGDRHYGIGADQLMIVRSSKTADFRMELYNQDGSVAEMCGNGIRCFARFLHRNRITRKKNLAFETGAGIIKTRIVDDLVEVDMGAPVLDGPRIPIDRKGEVVNAPLRTDKGNFNITAVSMGNPHAVIFVKKADMVDLATFGPVIEAHPVFPNRTNVEFAQVVTKKKIILRVWERGAGATLACGTGACATAVAGVLNGLTERSVSVHLPGGRLKIRWDKKTGHVFMTGPTEEVFTGVVAV